VTEEDI